MITLDFAKKLKPGATILVSKTKQPWTLKNIEIRGVLPFLHVEREGQTSVITPERLYLFEVAPESPEKVVSELRAELEPVIEAVPETQVELSVEDAQKLTARIEEHFTAEPELQKPARKAKKKA